MALLVQKFGGATLDSAEKISQIARRIVAAKDHGDQLVIVVSAMGKTTDHLVGLARALAPSPTLREMDTLLNTGEMVSMALLTIALNALKCPALSFCGHQAGIRTDSHFSNASILEIATESIKHALKEGQVAVVAGFQGENHHGELTTLGRGGSDTTALALAASLHADRCEILKDVSAVYSADPRLVREAQPIKHLSYDALLEMTFWGAKVLQYRSVEIAKHFGVPLYVGPAASTDLGTSIKETQMIEDSNVLSLNSHEVVLKTDIPLPFLGEALGSFRQQLDNRKTPFPQILHTESNGGHTQFFVTAPSEVIEGVRSLRSEKSFGCEEFSSVTATCRGSTRPELVHRVVSCLESAGIKVLKVMLSSMSVTVLVESAARVRALQTLHQLVAMPKASAHLAISG